MRLHELAKELGADSKQLLAIAKELGLRIKSHSSKVETGTIGILKAAWAEVLEEQAEEEAALKAKEQAEQEAAAAEQAAVEAERLAAEQAAAQAEQEAAEEEAAAKPAAEPEEPAPVEAAAEETESPAEPAVEEPAEKPDEEEDEEGEQKKVVVTIGGQVALPAELPEEATEEPVEEGSEVAPAAAQAQPEGAKAETSGPTRRRGARILGRIELKPQDVAPRQRPSAEPSEYDPLDPTRMAPARKHGAPRKGGEGDSSRGGKGRGGKPSNIEWVFDPEDNTALSAIRIGHLSGQRRPPMRRPPMRRNILSGARRSRRPTVRPTHGISVRPPIGVRELSEELGVKTREILMHFPEHFDPRDKNAVLEAEHLLELAVKMDREINVLEAETAEDRLLRQADERADELASEDQPRPPVVAVMGHVDHGKTSLLDALRQTKVATGEAGGITQRTSAYSVSTPDGKTVTFLDTPGHKAFTEMRLRGAQLTDVALLVVAADDGPMEQTLEAIDHAQAAGVPIVVAINKVDKANADPQMVRQRLASANVMVEGWGGEVGVVECSATTGQGLTELVERLALETEILELRADPAIPARGVVVDSRKDPQLGIVTTVVVKDGTLRAKDAVLAGTCVGRVRYLVDDQGRRIKEAGPSVPVQVLGFEQPPEAGADLLVVEDINEARGVVTERLEALREEEAVPAAVDAVTLDNLFDTIAARNVTEINVMIKADAQGTLDVLRRTIEDLQHPEVRFKVIRAAVGGVTEDDVLLASASGSLVIAFAVTADTNARAALQRTGVEIKYYEVIYEMTEDLEKALEGELAPEKRETVLGHAVIREVFKISRYGSIAGCYVTDGVLTRDARIRLSRDGKVIWTGRLDSLKRFKDDVREVKENYECGLHLSGYDDIRKEDVLEAFEITEVKRTLASAAQE
jgi:translation initiation factor IF-2